LAPAAALSPPATAASGEAGRAAVVPPARVPPSGFPCPIRCKLTPMFTALLSFELQLRPEGQRRQQGLLVVSPASRGWMGASLTQSPRWCCAALQISRPTQAHPSSTNPCPSASSVGCSKDNYKNECAAPPNNAKDFPYMAYIESPLGSCGGALVAPGYVLTAAQVRSQHFV
jgi:hypothetical protein